MKTAHEIWSYLNEKYGVVSDDDDKHKREMHEDHEHIHDMVVVEDCIRFVRRTLASLALHLLCVGSFWRCLRVIVRGVKSWLSQ